MLYNFMLKGYMVYAILKKNLLKVKSEGMIKKL